VLILGSSIIKRAEAYAKGRPMGQHLGLLGCKVIWAGVPGLRCSQVLHIANSLRQCTPTPSYMILHFGGNDLGTLKCGLLRKNMKEIMLCLMQLFPYTCLVYSCILPRLNWRFSYNDKSIEKSRDRVNRAMIHYVIQHGHKAIKHPDFNDKLPGLFLPDGVHLSPVGNDIFLLSIQSAIESFKTSSFAIYPAA
jgi:lysophospholipase L1-like esterase